MGWLTSPDVTVAISLLGVVVMAVLGTLGVRREMARDRADRQRSQRDTAMAERAMAVSEAAEPLRAEINRLREALNAMERDRDYYRARCDDRR